MNHILRLNQVKEICGISRSTLYALLQRGEFPAPISLGARAIGWFASDVNEWVVSRPPAGPSVRKEK